LDSSCSSSSVLDNLSHQDSPTTKIISWSSRIQQPVCKNITTIQFQNTNPYKTCFIQQFFTFVTELRTKNWNGYDREKVINQHKREHYCHELMICFSIHYKPHLEKWKKKNWTQIKNQKCGTHISISVI